MPTTSSLPTLPTSHTGLFAVAYPTKRATFPLTSGGYHNRLDFTDTLRGLTPNTTYYFTIRGNCGEYGASPWSKISTQASNRRGVFTTECGTLSLPFEETFQSYGNVRTVRMNNCWGRFSTYTETFNFPVVDRANLDGLDNQQMALLLYGSATDSTYAELPRLEDPGNGCLSVSYRVWGLNEHDTIKLVYMHEPAEGDHPHAYTVLRIHELSHVNAWDTITDQLTLDEFASDSGRLAFVVSPYVDGRSGYLYLDNVRIDACTECERATGFAINRYGAHTIGLNWNNNAHVADYQIAYGDLREFDITNPSTYAIHNATINAGTVGVSDYQLGGLTAKTGYSLSIRTVCGEGRFSEWSNIINVITEDDNTDIVSYYVRDLANHPNEDIQYEATSIDHVNHTINIWLNNWDDINMAELSEYFQLGTTSPNAKLMYDEGGFSFREEHNGYTVDYTYNSAGFSVKLPAYDIPDMAWTVLVRKIGCDVPSSLYTTEVLRRSMRVNWTRQTPVTHELVFSDVPISDLTTVTPMTIPSGVWDTSIYPLERDQMYYIYLRANCGSVGTSEWIKIEQVTADTIDCSRTADTLTRRAGSESDEAESYLLPIRQDRKYGLSQFIYDRGNDVPDGTYRRLAFEYAGETPLTRGVRIYLGFTMKENYTSTTNYETNKGELYYRGTITFTQGWNYIDLIEPFLFDGTLDQNLLITIEDTTGTTPSEYMNFATHRTDGYKSLTGGANVSSLSMTSPTGTTNGNIRDYYQQRPNIRLVECEHIDPCPSPDSVTARLYPSDPTTATLVWNDTVTDYPFEKDSTFYDIVVCKRPLVYPDASYLNRGLMQRDGSIYHSAEYDTMVWAAYKGVTLHLKDALNNGLLCPNTEYYAYVRTDCQSKIGDADPHKPFGGWRMVQFKTNSTCMPVDSIRIETPTKHTAIVTWKAGTQRSGSILDKNFSYRLLDYSQLNDTMTIAGDDVHGYSQTTKTFDNLICGHKYYLYITNDCGVNARLALDRPHGCASDRDTVSPYRYATFEMPTCCATPTNLTADSVTSGLVKLSWDSVGLENQWEIYYVYGHLADSQERARKIVVNRSDVTAVVTGTGVRYTYTLTHADNGLKANTDYRIYVRSSCGSDDYSTLSQGVNIHVLDTMARFTHFEVGTYSSSSRQVSNVW